MNETRGKEKSQMEYDENIGSWVPGGNSYWCCAFVASNLQREADQLLRCVVYIYDICLCDRAYHNCPEVSVYDCWKSGASFTDSDWWIGNCSMCQLHFL